jgi:hypothetical protein
MAPTWPGFWEGFLSNVLRKSGRFVRMGIKKHPSIIRALPTITTGILWGEDPLDEQLEYEEKNGQGDEAKKASNCPTGPGPSPQLLKILLFKNERCKLRMLRFHVR